MNLEKYFVIKYYLDKDIIRKTEGNDMFWIQTFMGCTSWRNFTSCHHNFENMFVLSWWYSYCSSLLLTLLPSYLLSTQLKCTWEMNRRRESTPVSHTPSWKECCERYHWLNLNPCIICIVVNMCNKRLRESIHKTVPIHLFTCAFVIMKLNDMFSVTHAFNILLMAFY